ncbi:SCP2 sterol-binding domain-containing protein [Guyparkeria hydrothermalis]|uniref:SCP2 sterol-binding domain-containing protein n=1 Tax=Guyparkeria hydrothermalis TaxID=923 RepID=UPI002020D087|nr:SCP2 sterol-binding domain-containing protein [Guyparkeria hydrothermalis]MCL7743735.1 SCP2 sterol-binding domain-containing protein [Guyparkeria hydrothermalis]
MVSAAVNADTFMGEKWAEAMCEEWNQTETLVSDLSGDTWAANTSDKGYKVIQMYRDECGAETRVELRIEDQEGKAMCTYGGAAKTASLNEDSDYLMHATDEDWRCMGEGSFGCGAMGSMMSGKLKFDGPKMEAASVVEPFNAFLKMTGEVEGSEQCPSRTLASGT